MIDIQHINHSTHDHPFGSYHTVTKPVGSRPETVAKLLQNDWRPAEHLGVSTVTPAPPHTSPVVPLVATVPGPRPRPLRESVQEPETELNKR